MRKLEEQSTVTVNGSRESYHASEERKIRVECFKPNGTISVYVQPL